MDVVYCFSLIQFKMTQFGGMREIGFHFFLVASIRTEDGT